MKVTIFGKERNILPIIILVVGVILLAGAFGFYKFVIEPNKAQAPIVEEEAAISSPIPSATTTPTLAETEVVIASTATLTPIPTLAETEVVIASTATLTPMPTLAETEVVIASTATLTPMPVTVTEEVVPETFELETEMFSANGVPTEVTSIKVNETGGWTVPEVVSIMLDNEGVEGCDDYDDAKNNISCTWTGGADHNQAQGPVVYDTVPEGSYWTTWVDSGYIEIAGYTIYVPSCGPHCSWGVLIRGWHLETHADAHAVIRFSNQEFHPHKYTRYPVPAGAGQFFSESYWTDQNINALNFDNCGIGLQEGVQDCDETYNLIFDINDGSLTILRYTAEGGYEVIWTNVIAYGRE